MKVICPACQQEVRAEDIELSSKIAKCSGCNNIFSFSTEALGGAVLSERPQIEAPRRFEIQNGPEGFCIIRRWFGPEAFFLLFFCIFWNAIVGSIAFSIFAKNGSWAGLLPLSFHIAAGLGVGYLALAMLLNKTTIAIGYDAIRIHHAPLPMPGGKTIPRQDVKQFYCDERISYSKNGRHVSYGVKVILSNEREIDFIDGLRAREEALFVEQKLETYLKLDDQAIPGELPR